MTNNAFAAALLLACIPTGIASAMLGVWMLRAFLAWFAASATELH